MTTPRQPGASVRSLDELLLRLPAPGGEPSNVDWAARLERTLSRIHAGLPLDPTQSDDVEAQLLRTPLPLEPEEPKPAAPFPFDTAEEREFDELRTPLKSGEHFPLSESVTTLGSSGAKPPRRRPWRYWLSSGVGVLAAAAAFAIYVNRGEREAGRAQVPAVRVAQEQPSPKPELTTAGVAQAPEPTEIEQASASRVKKARGLTGAQASTPAARMQKRSLEEPHPPGAETETEPGLTPAAGPSNLADHPSVGALNAALAPAVPVAQRCLSTAAPDASARVTFKADGSVQKVIVGGANLTDSTRACIQQAFARSRVEPFARAQFEVTRNLSMPKR